MALAFGEALWAAGDFAVDAYFTQSISRPLLRAAGRYVKRKAQRAAFDALVESVLPSKKEPKEPVKIGGDASRKNGLRGGRPPWKHHNTSRGTLNGYYNALKRPHNEAFEGDDDISMPSTSGAGGSGTQSDQPAAAAVAAQPAMGASSVVLGSGGALHLPKTVILERQRTFKHYLVYSSQEGWKYGDVTSVDGKKVFGGKAYVNKDWCYLPYQWLQCYMSSREYQAMNIEYKRWRPKTFSVTAHNIIPFVDDLKGVAGNVSPAVEISPLGFFEAFVDVQGELPHITVYPADLPNNEMKQPFMDRESCTLKTVPLTFNNWEGGENETFICLEQSPGYEFVYADQGFTFSHNVHPVDQQWRHALFPMNQSYQQYKDNYTQSDQYLTPIQGRTNNGSGTVVAENKNANRKVLPGMPGDNLLLESWLPHYPHSPPPKILLRVPEVQRASGVGCNYGFVLHVTYKMVIEAEPNHVCQLPIRFKDPTPGKLFFETAESFQTTGGDAHGMIKFGDKNSQYVEINKAYADNN
jgi:hypothetical protein